MWKKFGCRNLGDYYDVYVKTDVVFENFRKVCMEKYGLDPAHYYTAPGLSWDDSRRAGAVHRPGHALVHRKRHAGRKLFAAGVNATCLVCQSLAAVHFVLELDVGQLVFQLNCV